MDEEISTMKTGVILAAVCVAFMTVPPDPSVAMQVTDPTVSGTWTGRFTEGADIRVASAYRSATGRARGTRRSTSTPTSPGTSWPARTWQTVSSTSD
jgi:hypothetical protein